MGVSPACALCTVQPEARGERHGGNDHLCADVSYGRTYTGTYSLLTTPILYSSTYIAAEQRLKAEPAPSPHRVLLDHQLNPLRTGWLAGSTYPTRACPMIPIPSRTISNSNSRRRCPPIPIPIRMCIRRTSYDRLNNRQSAISNQPSHPA